MKLLKSILLLSILISTGSYADNYSNGGGGVAGEDTVARAAIATLGATKADKTTVDAQLAGKADQTALDAVVAANATQVELDAVEAKIPTGLLMTNLVRETNGDLTGTLSDASTFTVTAMVVHPPMTSASAELVIDAATQVATLTLPPSATVDTALADSPNAVTNKAVFDAQALDEKTANRVTTVATPGLDSTYPTEKAVRDAITAWADITPVTTVAAMTPKNNWFELTVDDGAAEAGIYWVNDAGVPVETSPPVQLTGDYIGSSATFAGLPTTSTAGKTAVNGDWAVLSTDDGVNNKGVYLTDGTTYSFAFELGSDALELTAGQVVSRTGGDYTTYGMVSAERLDEHLADRQTQTYFTSQAGSIDLSSIPNRRQKIRYFVRNTSNTSNTEIIYGADSEFTLELISPTNDVGNVAQGVGNTSFDLSPNSFGFVEYEPDGITVKASLFNASQLVRLPTKPATGIDVPFNSFVFIADTQQFWANPTGVTEQFTGDETANWIILNKGAVVPPTNYTNAEQVTEDNATAKDANVRLLEVPANYVGTDMTAGAKWLVQPSTAAVFPFTYPDINNGADLLTAVTNNILAPLSPETTSNKTLQYNSSISFDLSSFNLAPQERAFFESSDGTAQTLNIRPITSFGKTITVDGVPVTPTLGTVSITGIKKAYVWQSFGDAGALGGVTHVTTFKDSQLEAPKVSDLWTLNADSNNTPIEQDKPLHQTGRPIKSVLFTATANAERHTWDVNGKDLVLSISPVNTVPFTIQGIGATAATTSSWDISADGTVTDNATDTNEFSMTVTTEDRGTERVIKISSDDDLTQFKIWGNVIGAPAGLLKNAYVLDKADEINNDITSNAVYGSYTFNSSGESGFSWTNSEVDNVTGNITNNGAAGHVLSGGIYKVSYSAQKQTNGGAARVGYYVDGVAKSTLLGTTSNSGASIVDIVDATTSDKTIRFVRVASSGQGNTDAQLIIEKIRDNIQYIDKNNVIPVQDSWQDLPITDGTLVNDAWSLNPLGIGSLIDSVKAGSYIMLRWRDPNGAEEDVRIDLPLTPGVAVHGGSIFDERYKIRAYVRATTPDVLEIATGYSAANVMTGTLRNIRYFPPHKTVTNPDSITITNPNEADTTKVLKPNGDGTATFEDAPSGVLETSLATPYKIEGRKINGKQLWRVDFETAAPEPNSVVTVTALIPLGWDVIRGYSLQALKSNTFRGFEWYGTDVGFRWDVSQGTGNLNLRQIGNLIGTGGVVTGYFEYTRTDGQ